MFRRFLLLVSLSFSFGGFSFYAAVVVPIGGEVLDATSQGFVTREVTRVINAVMAVTLLIVSWEAIAGRRNRSRWANRTWSASIALWGLCCMALVGLHPRLDSFLDLDGFTVDEPLGFYRLHQVYLWISTVQWLVSLAVIWLLVGSWRDADRATTRAAASVSPSLRSG